MRYYIIMGTKDDCCNCQDMRKQLEELKQKHLLDFRTIKEKIISTDELIKLYQKKCQDYDSQTKDVVDLRTKLKQSQGNVDVIRLQLEKSLRLNDPLKKKCEDLEKETQCGRSEKERLYDKIRGFENLVQQLQVAVKEKEKSEDTSRLDVELRDHEIELHKKSLKKNEITIKRLKDKVSCERSEKKALRNQLAKSENRVKNVEEQLGQFKETITKLTDELHEAQQANTKVHKSPTTKDKPSSPSLPSHNLRSRSTSRFIQPSNTEGNSIDLLTLFCEMSWTPKLLSPLPPSPPRLLKTAASHDDQDNDNLLKPDYIDDIDEIEDDCDGDNMIDNIGGNDDNHVAIDYGDDKAGNGINNDNYIDDIGDTIDDVIPDEDHDNIDHGDSNDGNDAPDFNYGDDMVVNCGDDTRDGNHSGGNHDDGDVMTDKIGDGINNIIPDDGHNLGSTGDTHDGDNTGTIGDDKNGNHNYSGDNYSNTAGNIGHDINFGAHSNIDHVGDKNGGDVDDDGDFNSNNDDGKVVITSNFKTYLIDDDKTPNTGNVPSYTMDIPKHIILNKPISKSPLVEEMINASNNISVISVQTNEKKAHKDSMTSSTNQNNSTKLNKTTLMKAQSISVEPDQINLEKNEDKSEGTIDEAKRSEDTGKNTTSKLVSKRKRKRYSVRFGSSNVGVESVFCKTSDLEEIVATDKTSLPSKAKKLRSVLPDKHDNSDEDVSMSTIKDVILSTDSCINSSSLSTEGGSSKNITQEVQTCLDSIISFVSQQETAKKKEELTDRILVSHSTTKMPNKCLEKVIKSANMPNNVSEFGEVSSKGLPIHERCEDSRGKTLFQADPDILECVKNLIDTVARMTNIKNYREMLYNNITVTCEKLNKNLGGIHSDLSKLSTLDVSAQNTSLKKDGTDENWKTVARETMNYDKTCGPKKMDSVNLPKIASNVGQESNAKFNKEAVKDEDGTKVDTLSSVNDSLLGSPSSVARLSPIPDTPERSVYDISIPLIDEWSYIPQLSPIPSSPERFPQFDSYCTEVLETSLDKPKDKDFVLTDLELIKPSPDNLSAFIQETLQESSVMKSTREDKTPMILESSCIFTDPLDRPPKINEAKYVWNMFKKLKLNVITATDVSRRLLVITNLRSSLPFASGLIKMFKTNSEDVEDLLLKKYSEQYNQVDKENYVKDWQPILTDFEIRVAVVVHHISSKRRFGGMLLCLLRTLGLAICDLVKSKQDFVVLSMCRLYTVVARLNQDGRYIRLLCYDVIKELGPHQLSEKIMMSVSLVWPEIFWKEDNCFDDPSCQPFLLTLQTIMMSRDSAYAPAVQVFQQLCGWVQLPCDRKVLEELAYKLVRVLRVPGLVTLVTNAEFGPCMGDKAFEIVKSLELLAVILGWPWTNNVLIRELLWAILQEWKTNIIVKLSSEMCYTNCKESNQTNTEVDNSRTNCGVLQKKDSVSFVNKETNCVLTSECVEVAGNEGEIQKTCETFLKNDDMEALIVSVLRLLGLLGSFGIQQGSISQLDSLVNIFCAILTNSSKPNGVTFPVVLAAAYASLDLMEASPAIISQVLNSWKTRMEERIKTTKDIVLPGHFLHQMEHFRTQLPAHQTIVKL